MQTYQEPMLPAPVVPKWSTQIFECGKDEESCWWSTWCCWLVSSRNAESFELGSSFTQSCTFASFVAVCFIILMFSPLAGLVLIVGLIMYVFYRAHIRSQIRAKLGINGSIFEDAALHAFCTCCAVSQEAREANTQKTKRFDFCCGQDIDEVHTDAPVEGVMCDELQLPDNSSFLHHLKYISKTSKLILSVALLLFVTICLVRQLSLQTVFVLLLTFAQPIAVLWYFYWRKNRKHVLLDYVIKMFVYGFCIATTTSMVFEETLQTIFGVLLYIVLLMMGVHISMEPSTSGDGTFVASPDDLSASKVVRHVFKEFSRGHVLSFASNFGVQDTNTDGSTEDAGFDAHDARKYVLLAIVAFFIMAFVIAAGVEESMKHMAVRCTRFPASAPMKNPHAIMVYLLAAAAGFACAENIEYVFGQSESSLPGTSLFVGELFILGMRWLMPIHLICSVIQSVSLSKVLMGHEQINIFFLLLPAVTLHGTFDFVLFVMGYVGMAYEVTSIWFGIFSIFLPIAITIGGLLYAMREYKKIVYTYECGFERVNDDEAALNARL